MVVSRVTSEFIVLPRVHRRKESNIGCWLNPCVGCCIHASMIPLTIATFISCAHWAEASADYTARRCNCNLVSDRTEAARHKVTKDTKLHHVATKLPPSRHRAACDLCLRGD